MICMATNVKTLLSVGHKRLLFVSLLLIVAILASLCVCTLTVGVRVSSLEGAVHVGSEMELRAALNNTPPDTPVVIVLDRDIRLTKDSLVIGANKNITLTSGNKITEEYCKLFGAEDVSTIVVEGNGTLKLDGIIVTHTKPGRGVSVEESGCFILYSGEITGNTLYAREVSGGGVYNLGVFEMYGGKISKNYVSNYSFGGYGGGVHNNGIFTMYGGEITNNTAIMYGGGVCNTYCGTFTLFDGKITDNDGGHLGGGIYNAGTFNKLGGNISGNIAAEGNNVYPLENNDWLSNAIICVGVVGIVVGVAGYSFLCFKRRKNKNKQFTYTQSQFLVLRQNRWVNS